MTWDTFILLHYVRVESSKQDFETPCQLGGFPMENGAATDQLTRTFRHLALPADDLWDECGGKPRRGLSWTGN